MSADDKTITSRTASNHSVRHVRLPHTDPNTRVRPAREDPVHMAIVVTCLVVMTAVAVVSAGFVLAGGISVRGALTAVALTLTGIVAMSVSGFWFGRRPR